MTNMRKALPYFLFPCAAVLLSGMAPRAMAQTGRWGNPCEPSDGPVRILYDANQGVCWLADANLAGDPVMRALLGVTGINPNGTMDYATAQNWVAALNAFDGGVGFLGHNNWQLPVAPLVDSTCAATGPGGGSFGPLCTGSAMGNLYHVGLQRTYPDSVTPGFHATVTPFDDMKLSYYWAQKNDGSGEQEVFAFSNGFKGGVTTKYPYYYVLPMVPGSIGPAPPCAPGSGVVPYASGPAAGKAVYDCVTGYTWPADANLAARRNFGIRGYTSIVGNNGVIDVPLIDGGRMLFDTATQWIAAMNNSWYLGSSAWQLPATYGDLETLFTDLNLASGDPRLMWTGGFGSFQNLQPFYYWGCQRDQKGDSRSPCTDTGPGGLPWTFNFDDGFQGTAEPVQRFFVMVYYPAPL